MATATKTATTTKGKKDKKETTKPATERKPRARKEGLRSFQVRILKCLAKAKGPLTRTQISEKAPAHPTNQTNLWGIGLVDPDKRKEAEKKTQIPSLLTLGFVRERMIPGELNDKGEEGRKERVYEITASGRKAMEKAIKEDSGK